MPLPLPSLNRPTSLTCAFAFGAHPRAPVRTLIPLWVNNLCQAWGLQRPGVSLELGTAHATFRCRILGSSNSTAKKHVLKDPTRPLPTQRHRVKEVHGSPAYLGN